MSCTRSRRKKNSGTGLQDSMYGTGTGTGTGTGVIEQQEELLDREVINLKAERSALLSEMGDAKLKADEEILRLKQLFIKAQSDKKKLSGRLSKFINNEKELVLEIDRLKHRSNGCKNGINSTKKATKLVEEFVKRLDDEKNYWKNETNLLNKFIKSIGNDHPTAINTINRSRSRSLSPSRKIKLSCNSNKVDKELETCQEERDYYRRRCELLSSMRRTASSSSPSPTRKRYPDTETELERMKKERDQLQVLLDKFERHMAEIQVNVKVLTTERNKLAEMYTASKRELDSHRKEIVRSGKNSKNSVAVQQVLERVEFERDETIAELRRMTTERDSLRERLKISTETHLSDRAHFEQKLQDLESALDITETDKKLVYSKWNSVQHEIDLLRTKIRNESRTNENQKANLAQFKLNCDKAERREGEARRKLERIELELVDARNELIESKRRVEISQEKSDAEADRFREEIDTLQNQVESKDKVLLENRRLLSDFESELSRFNDDKKNICKERDLLKRQRNELGDELSSIKRSKDESLGENRLLLEELSAVRKTANSLSDQLERSLIEQDDLKIQIQGYVKEVNRVEGILSNKENQRTQLLEQYKFVSATCEKTETQRTELESQSSTLKLELISRETELKRLRDLYQDSEARVRELSINEASYTAQITHLNQSIKRMEEYLRRGDLDARDSEQLLRELQYFKEENDKISRKLEKLLKENDTLKRTDRSQLDETKIDALNADLMTSRTKNIQHESDLDQLRRDLTTERFEKERLAQQLRSKSYDNYDYVGGNSLSRF